MIMPVCGRKGRKMELIVPFDSQSESPLYEQIYQYIKNEIRRGKLEAGSRLPSTRILARNLRLSRSTTQMAYDQLLSEGYIEALPCKGYFVCKIEELVEVRQKGGGSFVEPGDTGKDCYEVDFSPRGIDLDSFPFNTWRKISRNTLITPLIIPEQVSSKLSRPFATAFFAIQTPPAASSHNKVFYSIPFSFGARNALKWLFLLFPIAFFPPLC